MEQNYRTVKDYFKALKIIFWALVYGQLFFAGICFFLHKKGFEPVFFEYRKIFEVVIPLTIISAIVTSLVVFRKKLEACRAENNLGEKLSLYRKSLIIRYSLIELSTFLTLMIYLLAGTQLFLILAILTIGYFIYLNPTVAKTATDLELTGGEEQALNNPDHPLHI